MLCLSLLKNVHGVLDDVDEAVDYIHKYFEPGKWKSQVRPAMPGPTLETAHLEEDLEK